MSTSTAASPTRADGQPPAQPAIIVRIDREDHRRSLEGRSYSVRRMPDGRTVLAVFSTEEPTDEPTALVSLEDNEVAYVMAYVASSSRLATIEVVRPQRPKAAELRTAPGRRK